MAGWINADRLTEAHVGFIYRIDELSAEGVILRSYIGKKLLTKKSTRKLSAKALAALPKKPGKKPTKQTSVTESDWQTYWSSSKELKAAVKAKGEGCFRRTILAGCVSKRQMSYLEMKFQFLFGVLESPENWYNGNIGGKLFSRDAHGYTLFD